MFCGPMIDSWDTWTSPHLAVNSRISIVTWRAVTFKEVAAWLLETTRSPMERFSCWSVHNILALVPVVPELNMAEPWSFCSTALTCYQIDFIMEKSESKYTPLPANSKHEINRNVEKGIPQEDSSGKWKSIHRRNCCHFGAKDTQTHQYLINST